MSRLFSSLSLLCTSFLLLACQAFSHGHKKPSLSMVEDNILYISNAQGTLIAQDLEAESGAQPFWSQNLPALLIGPPVIADQLLLVPTQEGALRAYDKKTGHFLWIQFYNKPLVVFDQAAPPLPTPQGILWAGADASLMLLSPSDGSLRWKTQLSYPQGVSDIERLVDIVSPLLIDGSQVYVAGYQGALTALELKTGRILWQHPLSTLNPLIIDPKNPGLLISLSTQGLLQAWDKKTGRLIWQYQAPAKKGPWSMQADIGQHIELRDKKGHSLWIDWQSGSLNEKGAL